MQFIRKLAKRDSHRRRLIFIPIRHRLDDLPDFTKVAASGLSAPDKEELNLRLTNVWGNIQAGLRSLSIDYSKTKVFFESTTSKPKIKGDTKRAGLADLAFEDVAQGEATALELYLHIKGAKLVTTESKNIYEEGISILEEIFGHGYQSRPRSETENLLEQFAAINRERDQYIARQINKKLGKSETGILVIGAGHNVLGFLDEDIDIELINPELEGIVNEQCMEVLRKRRSGLMETTSSRSKESCN